MPSKPFRYRDLGSMAAVSRRRAIVSFHGIRLHGYLGWLAWLTVHITFMTGFKNRFSALVSWSFSFIGSSRQQQVIDEHRMPGRPPPAPPDDPPAVVDARTARVAPPAASERRRRGRDHPAGVQRNHLVDRVRGPRHGG